MSETELPHSEPSVVELKKSWLLKLKQPKIFLPVLACILLYTAFNVWLFFYGPKVFGKNKRLWQFRNKHSYCQTRGIKKINHGSLFLLLHHPGLPSPQVASSWPSGIYIQPW